MTADTYVIVGASLAGAKAAETLRDEGFDGAIVLIGAETERPYERPPLSKDLLLGKADRNTAFVHEPGWYAEHDVDLRLGSRVTSSTGPPGRCAWKTARRSATPGCCWPPAPSPRRLPVPGADLDGLLYLRTLADSEALLAVLRRGGQRGRSPGRAGSGWRWPPRPGRRAARSPSSSPRPRRCSGRSAPSWARCSAACTASHGVQFRLGEGISELRGDGSGSGAAGQAARRGAPGADLGRRHAGRRRGDRRHRRGAEVGLAADAGLEVDNGILVDASLRTSDPDIFAAGDVASAVNPLLGRRIRVEHWANALNGGPAAARAMLGQQVSYDRVPYFFSDQYDLGMEAAGVPEPGGYDQVVYRGEPQSREFVAFWLRSGVVVAGMNVNVWDVNDAIQDLIRSGSPVDAGAAGRPRRPAGGPGVTVPPVPRRPPGRAPRRGRPAPGGSLITARGGRAAS